jgi:hypothetical protein
MNKLPRLLVLKRLLEPSFHAQRVLAEICAKLQSVASKSLELKGYFVLAVSALETMFTNTYIYFRRSFPGSFDFRDTQFSKAEILASNLSLDLIQQQLGKTAISRAYASFSEQLSKFLKTVSITNQTKRGESPVFPNQ